MLRENSDSLSFDPGERDKGKMPDRIAVTAAEFVRNIGHWQNQALEQPVAITHHGRERLVLVSSKRFEEARAGAQAASVDATAPELNWLLDSVTEGYVLQTREFEILRVNAVAAGMFGLTPEEMLGRKLKDLLPATGAAIFNERAQMVLRTGQIETFEGEGAAFNNHVLVFRMAPLGEKIVTLVANHTARAIVDEQKKVADAVGVSLQAFSQIGGVRVDTFGRITIAWPSFLIASGFDAQSLDGLRLTDIITPPLRRAFTDAFETAVRSKENVTKRVTFVRKNGAPIDALASIVALELSGTAGGAVVMCDFGAGPHS